MWPYPGDPGSVPPGSTATEWPISIHRPGDSRHAGPSVRRGPLPPPPHPFESSISFPDLPRVTDPHGHILSKMPRWWEGGITSSVLSANTARSPLHLPWGGGGTPACWSWRAGEACFTRTPREHLAAVVLAPAEQAPRLHSRSRTTPSGPCPAAAQALEALRRGRPPPHQSHSHCTPPEASSPPRVLPRRPLERGPCCSLRAEHTRPAPHTLHSSSPEAPGRAPSGRFSASGWWPRELTSPAAWGSAVVAFVPERGLARRSGASALAEISGLSGPTNP